MCVQIHAVFDSYFSLGDISGEIATRVLRRFPGTRLHSILRAHPYWDDVLQRRGVATPFGDFIDPALAEYSGNVPDAPIGIFIGPTPFALPLLKSHAVRIGFLVCETSRVPPDWAEVSNQLDLTIVPSSFCRAAFVSSGATRPIRVIPHGLGEAFRPYEDVHPPARFTIFNTFGAFAPPERKGFRELLECFATAFPGDTTTALVIRTHATDSALEHIDRYSSRATVELEPLTYGTREQFARRLCSVHCVAHPSKGEGFGLVPFQAIGCETPVIAPATTGMAEYINPGTATVLRTGPTIKGQTWQNQPGEYHDVDTAALIEALLDVRSNWSEKRAQVHRAGADFRERFAWDRVLAPLLESLEAVSRGTAITKAIRAWT